MQQQKRYSLVAIILHWVIAAALAFQLAVGFGLEDLGPRGFALYQLHKSVGIAILLLTVLRLGWRFFAPRPSALEQGWQGRLAGFVHFGLYVFMIGAPLTGWLMVSTNRIKVPTVLFGTLPWPHLPVPDRLNGLFDGMHGALGWIGIALFVLHVAGALRHQWLLRDPVMQRMSPGRSARPVLIFAACLPLAWWLGLAALREAGEGPKVIPSAAQLPVPIAEAPPASGSKPEPVPANATAAPISIPAPRWTINPGGTLAFSVNNGGVRIAGRFARWTGNVLFNPDRPETADIRITADLASASVGDATQDTMLTGADFFDVAAHPRAIFTTKSVRNTGAGKYTARGTLSLKGISKPQTLSFALSGTGLARHVEGRATISRKAFGIGTGQADETLATDVALNFSFDAKGTVAK